MEYGHIRNIHYGDIHTKLENILNIKNISLPYIKDDYLDFNKIDEEDYCINGDIIFADASENYDDIGKCIEITNISFEKVLSGLHTILAREKSKTFQVGLKGYIFNSHYIRKQIKKSSVGAKVLGISKGNLSKIKVPLPPLKEQQKIADILTTQDKIIELKQKLIEEKEKQKKYLMQNLLTGKIRLKGFKDKWKEISLKKILKERKEYSNKFSNYEHVTLSKEGIYPKTERYDRDYLVKDENKKYKITKLNDICYNPANLKFGVICLNNFGTAIFSPIYITFEINNKFSIKFISLYLTQWDFINAIRKYEEGTVYERMAVKPEDFISYKFNIPPLQEQNAIAQILSKADEEIELLQKELEQEKQKKKALMQLLLTGIVRV